MIAAHWSRYALVPHFAILIALLPQLYGFVLLGQTEARLPATPTSPTVNFVWDGQAPTSIQNKDQYLDGQYAALDDQAMMKQLLTDAMALWNNVPGSFLRLSLQQGNAVDDATDKINSIMVKKDTNLSTAAYAAPTPDPADATTISDCDVHINNTAVDAQSLAYTIAHELGHCVGLGHAHTNYGAIMGYARGPRTMTLGQDDRAGVIYLYPDPAVFSDKAKEFAACGVISSSNAADKHPGSAARVALLAGILLPGLWAWRRRRAITTRPEVSRFSRR